MAYFLLGFATLVLLYFSQFAYNLIRNIHNARATGLPYVVQIVDQNHFFWMVTSVPLRNVFKRVLPAKFYQRLTLTIYGWEFHEKLRPFETFAEPQGNDKTFLIAGCGQLELWTAEPAVVFDILRRPRDFEVPKLSGLFMAQFGHNVLTTNGERWAKQRKIVASVINERISKAVFDESVHQTRGLLEELVPSEEGVDSADSTLIFDMLKKITIHVLSNAGMGTKVPWKNDDANKPQPGYKMTYIDACKSVMDGVTGPLILPISILLGWPSWLPGYQRMKTLGHAKTEFPQHTKNMLDNERASSAESGKLASSTNIMNQLLQASDKDSATGQSLSEEEMIGNLFIFTAAGFETTANTLSYTVLLLAKHPKWQKWLIEEIDELMPTGDTNSMNYAEIFPKVTRIMAFMLEVLRMYTPVCHIARATISAQTIATSSGTVRLPGNTGVYTNNIAVHLDPSAWRDINHASDPPFVVLEALNVPDEYAFRPSRWLNAPGSPQPFYQPPKGNFVPWSGGPRVCPGQKMAQVEFTAILLTLLQRHRIDAVPLGSETQDQIAERLEAKMRDSMSVLTLQVNGIYDPGEGEGVNLRLSKRIQASVGR